MSEIPSVDSESARPADGLPEHLPPVEPPSAGFIVQLFLVPAVIVAVVIGVYLLFGRMAAGDTDWRQLVSDIKSDNSNIRWRAALNLAEALDAEGRRPAKQGRSLAEIPEIAGALNDLTLQQLQIRTPNDEQQQQLQFLLKALGRTDVIDAIWPALQEALSPSQPTETRKQALQAIAMIAGRRRERQQSLDSPQVLDALFDAAAEGEPVLRLHAAFALGLIPGGRSELQLTRMLEDPDSKTRINAAIGLARASSLGGLPVFRDAVRDALAWAREDVSQTTGDRAFEQQLILRNTVQALQQLAPKMPTDERREFASQLQELEEAVRDTGLRLQIKEARLELEQSPAGESA
ncbi:MAG: HEAT repeat domain-containing protein [Planctomyces sp.]|nr:HEAT repeat domain-containing protein [Planctomyces sp.]